MKNCLNSLKLSALMLMTFVVTTTIVFAQDLPPAESGWIDGLVSFLVSFGETNPKLAPLLATLWLVGLGVRLLRTAITSFVEQSPSQKDDLAWKKANDNMIVKVLFYVLDVLFRIKKPAA